MWNNQKPYIIAEIGMNHNGDMRLAKELINKAKKVGADAVKFQIKMNHNELATHKHATDLDSGRVRLENIPSWESKELGLNNIFEQSKKFQLQPEQNAELFQYCHEVGIQFGSSTFSKEGIEFLVKYKVDFLKIASMDVNNLELIEYSLSTGLPVAISTGMASLGEIEKVVEIVPKHMYDKVTLLHCTSLYPPQDNIVNLSFIKTMQNLFPVPIGYSDHTIGTSIPLASVALGAKVIEKHFTLDKNLPGWDHSVSSDPDELKFICVESKRIVDALGDGRKLVSKEELEKRLKFRRSLVTRRKLNKGDLLTKQDITLKRPGTGIQPNELKYAINRTIIRDLEEDQTIFWEDLI